MTRRKVRNFWAQRIGENGEKYLHIGLIDPAPSKLSPMVALAISLDRQGAEDISYKDPRRVNVYAAVRDIGKNKHDHTLEYFTFELSRSMKPDIRILFNAEQKELVRRERHWRENNKNSKSLPWWKKLKNMIFGG